MLLLVCVVVCVCCCVVACVCCCVVAVGVEILTYDNQFETCVDVVVDEVWGDLMELYAIFRFVKLVNQCELNIQKS